MSKPSAMRVAETSKLQITSRKRTRMESNISQLERLGCKIFWELYSSWLIITGGRNDICVLFCLNTV